MLRGPAGISLGRDVRQRRHFTVGIVMIPVPDFRFASLPWHPANYARPKHSAQTGAIGFCLIGWPNGPSAEILHNQTLRRSRRRQARRRSSGSRVSCVTANTPKAQRCLQSLHQGEALCALPFSDVFFLSRTAGIRGPLESGSQSTRRRVTKCAVWRLTPGSVATISIHVNPASCAARSVRFMIVGRSRDASSLDERKMIRSVGPR